MVSPPTSHSKSVYLNVFPSIFKGNVSFGMIRCILLRKHCSDRSISGYDSLGHIDNGALLNIFDWRRELVLSNTYNNSILWHHL